jgi:very-short-patch-repair endonuclease
MGEHEARDQALRLNGWRVLRFWNNDIVSNDIVNNDIVNNDIVENRAGVLQSIAAALGPHPEISPHPNPPPRAGEGTQSNLASFPPPRAGEG